MRRCVSHSDYIPIYSDNRSSGSADVSLPSKKAKKDKDDEDFVDVDNFEAVELDSPPDSPAVPRGAKINFTALTRKLADARHDREVRVLFFQLRCYPRS